MRAVNTKIVHRSVLASGCLLLVACTGAGSGQGSDEDEEVTANADAGADARTDAGADARTDAGVDAGADARADAGRGGADGSSPVDASRDGSVADASVGQVDGATGGDAGSNPAVAKGCKLTSSAKGTFTLKVAAREALVSIPAGYNANTPYPVVVALHGGGDNGPNFRGWSGVETASAGGAIFVYPNGINGIWEDEVYNGNYAFLRAMVDALANDYCIDRKAVFSFGFSWGAGAALRLACSASDFVAGVVSVAGDGPLTSNCGAPVPTMIIHGRNDPSEGFGSGEASLRAVRKFNACGTTSAPTDPSPCVRYDACSKPVLWCAHDGVHEIPEFAHAGIWNFFQSLR